MSLTYDDLRDRIGHKLGYGIAKANWSGDATRSAVVERILVDAIRRFSDPDVLPGEQEKHQWAYLTPTLTIQLVSGVYAYDLPTGFVSFLGPLTFAPGTTDWYPPIKVMGADAVMKRLGEADDPGIPCIGGVRAKNSTGVHKTAWELVIAPVPDGDYTTKARAKINPAVPGADGDVPLGGQSHEMTLIEACLAECDLFDEVDRGHNARFMECLRSSVSQDRQTSCPQTVGYIGDPGNSVSLYESDIPAVTYLGSSDW